MEDAGGEDQVKARFRKRRRLAVILDQLSHTRVKTTCDLQALGADIESGQFSAWKHSGELGKACPNAATEIQHGFRFGIALLRPKSAQFVQLVAGEIVRLLAGDLQVLLMRREVFLGKDIKFGSVHQLFASLGPVAHVISSIM